jgi:hypothetical protein
VTVGHCRHHAVPRHSQPLTPSGMSTANVRDEPKAAMDELNGQNRQPTNKQFVLLVIGMAIVIALFYATIALIPPNWSAYPLS